MLELRVLNGTHAGARALLADLPQLIGSGEDCTLILSDEGVQSQHASLEHRRDGSTVLRWLNSELPPLVMRAGQGAQMGPVRVAIEQIDAPWREDVPLVEPGPAVSAQVSAPRTGRVAARRWWLACAAAVLLALLALAAVSALRAWRGSGQVAPAPQHPEVAPDAALAHAIARLGLTGRVRIDLTHPQAPVVTAGFLPEEDLRALAQQLSRLSPRPKLVQLDEAELVAAVTHEVRQLGSQEAPLAVRHLGAGRFLVEGRVAGDDERARVMARLEQGFPLASGFESALMTDADAAAAMLEELRRLGLGRLQGAWIDGTLVLETSLAPGDQVRWERALVAAAARHGLPFKAQVQVQTGMQQPAGAALPFTVRSVVHSPLPHVTLADGRKLATGARLEGWQLKEIGPGGLVFDGPQGQRIRMER